MHDTPRQGQVQAAPNIASMHAVREREKTQSLDESGGEPVVRGAQGVELLAGAGVVPESWRAGKTLAVD
jgi:hypothetical protein